MRQKVRRLSKSALSVLLSIVMVAVGVVNVSAFTFTTNHKIYFDATKWSNRTKVYVNFLNSDQNSGNLQEMTQIGTTGIYRYENNSVSGSNYGVMFVLNNGWSTAGQWDGNNSKSTLSQYATNCTDSYGLDLEKDHVYYFRASGSNKNDGVIKDHDYNGTSYTINNETVRNNDRIWSFNLTATSSVATTPTGTPSTGNASSTAGGKVAVNASYFNGWESVSSAGDSTESSTSSTYSSAAKGSTVTWKVKQVYPGYVFDGWYSDETSTGETNRLSTNQNYSETITGGLNGSITRYAHFHRGQATITTAVSPSGAGTAQVSTSQSGEYGSSVTVQSDTTVYLKAENTNDKYEFSEWQAVSGLTFDNRTGATTSATATATATATAVFLPINYNLTKQNPAHAKIKIPNQARWGETVTPTATTDVGYKISKYKYSTDGGSTWTDVTPGSGFTMPEHNVIVSAEVTECTAYTVTMTPNGNGSISARTADGQTISSGAQVNEGTVITFTAAPANNNAFTGWSGTGSAASISGTESQKTVTINANTEVMASFSANVVQLVKYANESATTGTASAMNYNETTGYYRSVQKVTSGSSVFTVSKTIADTTTYAVSIADGSTWWITDAHPAVTPQHWSGSEASASKKYSDHMGSDGTQHYVFYDPDRNKIWLSTSADGSTGVKVIAKDGSFADNAPNNPATSAGWGNTTLTVTVGGTAKTKTSIHNNYAEQVDLSRDEVDNAATKIKVSTTPYEENYYVYGFDVNGLTIKATKNGSAYKCEFSPSALETNISNYIEITPIYMLNDPSIADPSQPTTTIRFYVRSFSGDVKARWGGELYCYSYDDSEKPTNGAWPGQPMVNLGGGTYYMDLPLNTKAITLSNASADWIHAETLGVDLANDATSWEHRNKYQCQSYDYDDFKYIYEKPGVGQNDEDIIFDFKYKQGDWGKAGLDNFPDNQFEKQGYSETNFPNILDPSNSSYQWEKYTDFYDNPVDLWGTRLTSNYNNNPVRVVVQGYYDTSAANASYYATTYVVYVPSTPTGANPTYTLVDYTNSPKGYGKKSRSEFLQRSAEEMTALTAYAGQPVEITYEYAIYKNRSTINTHQPNQEKQFAERADGVWYYSETKPVKGNIIIQYADNAHSAFTDDTFAIEDHPGIDYDGDDFTVNEGTTTHAKAYFVDNNYGRSPRVLARPTNAPFDVDYDNRTVSWAYTDGYDYYDVKAEESPDGEYTFIGWYKMSAGKPEFASSEYTYQIEATANETFIARYVKTPAGQVKLAHKPVTNPSGGTGERKVWYDIVRSDTNTSLLPAGTTHEANGAITVPKTYVKYNKGYVLKVKFEVDPDDNSRKNGIYYEPEASNANLLTENGMETHNNINVDSFALNHSGTTATVDTEYVEFSVPIDQFFKRVQGTTDEYEFDSDKSLIEVFSDYDRIETQNLTITKATNVSSTTDAFKIKLYTSTDNSTWTAYTTALAAATGSTTLTASSGEYTIHKDEQWVMQNIPINTYVKIEESDCNTTAGYTFDGMTGDGVTVDTTNRTGVVQMTADKTVTINNKEDIKYQYEIKYIYEGYSAKTYKTNDNLTDANRAEGPTRSFTVNGEITDTEMTDFFTRNGETIAFIDDNARKTFLGNHAPLEDDFMLNINWDGQTVTTPEFDAETKTISFETTATVVSDRTVHVQFNFPYDVNSANYTNENDAYRTEKQHLTLEVQYGNWATYNNTFVTAPLTLKKDDNTTMYFQYWQIKSMTSTDENSRNKGKVETDYKKCFYADFNMSMYQDSYVEPIYKTAEEPGAMTTYNPGAASAQDTQNGEARINFIENSRNQWNNNGAQDLSTEAQKQAGDRVYSDFLLTFGYKDQLLKSNTDVTKAGFVLEQVRELDKDLNGKFVTKTEQDYQAEYASSIGDAKINAKTYIQNGTDAFGDSRFVANNNIVLSQLDNKNQTKFSFNFKNKAYGNLNPGTAKNYVYRAYSYILVDDTYVISDPVYFTIYDIASIEVNQ